MWVTLEGSFGLDIGHLYTQLVITLNYRVNADFHNLQVFSSSSDFTSSCLVTDSNNVYSPAPGPSLLWTAAPLQLNYSYQSQSQSYIATDGRSISKSWCRAPSGAHDQIFIIVCQLRFCFCGASIVLFISHLHWPSRKHSIEQYFYFRMRVCCRGNVFTEPFSRNVSTRYNISLELSVPTCVICFKIQISAFGPQSILVWFVWFSQ
jgi:hypothetical protein